ncbi:carbohydrate kinase family protein [Candidatus Parabeggiatoa sp. HSG14]|uniref:carbohydrate kinase family protein n=1 Tax=Candidatus Parabeggiatoa sp. HSG14 TaxID=3055593 RepID=UPI0025A72273|nr:carbohydrate kinase family protein [Thiotrichales bacterium HSG14]
MSALICGSFAFDTIMVFNDKFKHHILPEQVHIINVSFLVPDLRREFGGCAGNIAYNLNLLGGDALPMGTVGMDFAPYAEWIDHCGISRTYVTTVDHTYTAQAFITTDMDDNQITAFHPGAMNHSHLNKVSQAKDVSIGIISPDGRDGMIEHARQFVAAGIPFIFDPGQGMPMFDGNDLLQFIEQATWVTVNDYEWQLMQERTGLSPQKVAQMVQALIITKGEEGAEIYTKDTVYQIPNAKPKAVNDPTGCGDAFRGGLLYGLMKDIDWETTGRIASLMGAIKIEHHGTQNHSFTLEQFKERFKQNFGYALM